MPAETRVSMEHESDIVAARREGRALASRLGFSSSEQTVIATAISEVARNILLYANRGEVVVRVEERAGRRSLVVIARDEGPGIPDLERAMQDGYSTSNGLGLGLPGSRRMMDEFEIVSQGGKGTTITMRKWAP
jgi:serine/threonine-protein kinase RsbT